MDTSVLSSSCSAILALIRRPLAPLRGNCSTQQMSLAMRRARRRYFWPNVKGWFITSLFAGAVYMYSIEAVRQDDFVRAFSSFLPLPPC